jgi:hypothetical protein
VNGREKLRSHFKGRFLGVDGLIYEYDGMKDFRVTRTRPVTRKGKPYRVSFTRLPVGPGGYHIIKTDIRFYTPVTVQPKTVQTKTVQTKTVKPKKKNQKE